MLKSYIDQELSTFDYKMIKVIDHIQNIKYSRFSKMTLKSKIFQEFEKNKISSNTMEDKYIDVNEEDLTVGNSEI